MAAMGVMDTNRFHRNKPAHRRKDSGEIDVFEASRYFSGGPETRTYTHNSSQRPMKEDTRWAVWGGRKSLDISFKNSSFTSHSSYMVNDKYMIQAEKKKKKSKLPISPGGKLASFLNSLFSQLATSRKKSKSCPQSVKEEDHDTSPGGRRRSSSISHFYGFGSNRSKSLYSSSSSGFRTPPPMSQPSNIEVHDKARTMASLLESTKAAASTKEQRDQYYRDHDRDKKGHHTKINLEKKVTAREGDRTWVSEVSSQKSIRRAYEQKVEDGGDSDSSSDLFDLPNYALGSVYSNGLPVYETTHLQDINRSRAIMKQINQ